MPTRPPASRRPAPRPPVLRTQRAPVETRPARRPPPMVREQVSMIIARLAQRTRYMDPGLAARWADIAGDEFAALCRPGRLSGGAKDRALEVFAADGAAAARLKFHEGDLIRRLRAYFGPDVVTRISIKQTDNTPTDAAPRSSGGGGLSRFRNGG